MALALQILFKVALVLQAHLEDKVLAELMVLLVKQLQDMVVVAVVRTQEMVLVEMAEQVVVI
ncbi:MAG: hypothetical protein ABT940_14460 [Alphaproteobacteria bacterium]